MSDTSFNPPVIGILGDGQLAAMMARDYKALGGVTYIYGESEESPAGSLAEKFFYGTRDDIEALSSFFSAVDIVTLENEFFAAEYLIQASKQTSTPVYPNPEKFGLIEDKISEKRFFESLGIPVAPYFEVTSKDDLLDKPGFLKFAKGGYDGIGTYRVKNLSEVTELYEQVKSHGQLLFEHDIEFSKELSLIVVSGVDGHTFYPLVETHQESGTCRYVSYPSGVSSETEAQAQDYIERVMSNLDTRGVFAFEFFLTKDQELILNESAPRPHNSGHISLNLYNVSQFENHMRAVAGLEVLAPVAQYDSALMLNLLASKDGVFDSEAVLAAMPDKNLELDLYGKKMSRPMRKMGHINLWGANQWQRAKQILNDLDI